MKSNKPEKKEIITIAEIESDSDLRLKGNLNKLNIILNLAPPSKFIKIQDGVKHVPVDKVKYLLTKIFIEWWHEIKQVHIIANSVTVVSTLHYKNPVSGEWCKMDGIGAAPINTKKGAKAMDWNEVVHDSVHKCAGAADSFALKNAAKKLGRIFGAELMVDDIINYTALTDNERFNKIKE